MIKVIENIDVDEIRNSDDTLNYENGLRILFENIGLNEIQYGEVNDDIWDDAHEFLNNSSFEYQEFVCNEAGFDTAGLEGDILNALAFQVELNNKTMAGG